MQPPKKNTHNEAGNQSGAKRDRTADLLNAIQTLSQLSYSPITIFDARKSNYLDFICQSIALIL